MKKLILIIVLILNILSVWAQDTAGIHFTQNLSWRQVLQKAKNEHKYIFVDGYATWCGPCKAMEADVYPLKAVGDVYNRDFISVKLQMDKTSHDSQETKSWYDQAEMIASDYSVNAYPTFLFFDPDGKPVHKVTGALDLQQFIALAGDAQNPDKQYYSLLKNFQPGKLDTAEEKGLAGVFIASDKQLAGKIAADYFSRIPEDRLNTPYHHYLMRSLLDNESMKAWAVGYITGLDNTKLANENSLELIRIFYNEPQVQETVKKYLDGLTDEQLYTKVNISYLSMATVTPNDKRGFDIFYLHPGLVDAVMGQKGFAHGQTEGEIKQAEFTPLFEDAKKTGNEPDFNAISASIAGKHKGDFAGNITVRGKADWFNYLVNDKKEDQHWPDLINAHIAQIERFNYDTVAALTNFVNDVSYVEIFLHSNTKSQVISATKFMKSVVDRHPGDWYFTDTYAVILYKAGQLNEALRYANKALAIATGKKSQGDMDAESNKITAMKRGEPIWNEKEYQ